MNAVDPSGYFFKKLFKGIKKAINNVFRGINKVLGDFAPIAAIAVAFIPGMQGFAGAMLKSFIAGGVASGSLKGATIGAFSAALFYGIGTSFDGVSGADSFGSLAHAGKTLAHGAAGGIMSVLNGGKFGHGFVSAGFTQLAAPGINRLGVRGSRFSPKRVFAAALVGGTSSALTGSKFANGAVTGAFSRAFNDESHHQKKLTRMQTICKMGCHGVSDFEKRTMLTDSQHQYMVNGSLSGADTVMSSIGCVTTGSSCVIAAVSAADTFRQFSMVVGNDPVITTVENLGGTSSQAANVAKFTDYSTSVLMINASFKSMIGGNSILGNIIDMMATKNTVEQL